MPKKYIKPTMRDLNGVPLAIGMCSSGFGVPNQCVNYGYYNATSCISGTSVLTPIPSCTPGYLALSCAAGTGAGAG